MFLLWCLIHKNQLHNSSGNKVDVNELLAVMEAQSGCVLLTTDAHQRPPFCFFFVVIVAWQGGGGGSGWEGLDRSDWPGKVRCFHKSHFSLKWFSLFFTFSFTFATVWRLESPQIVLLGAGAFPQGDVVHSHLANSASAAFPLQDHLANSRNAHCHCQLVTASNLQVSCYTHTFQSRPPQRDLGVPPAAPARPSPHRWTVLLFFLHKHLQHTHVVARQLVPERQAQIAVVPGGRKWEDQLGSSPPPFVAHLGDGEVTSTCCDGDWDQLLAKCGLKFSVERHGGSSAPLLKFMECVWRLLEHK